jgi:TP901 family phage tail tape measure protein
VAEQIGDAFVQVGADISQYNSKMQQVRTSFNRLGDGLTRVGTRLTTRVTLPILGIGTAAGKMAVDFEAAMRNVNVIAREGSEQFANTREAVLNLAREMGKQPTGLAEALFGINSAGKKGAEGLAVLEEATRAAVAGNTEVATTAKAITGVLNAYNLSVEEAADVSDILFKTNEEGVLTVQELAETMGDVSATAAAAKVPFDEVAAAIATMTKGNINAAESTTALNRLILAFIKPTEQMARALASTEEESGALLLQTRGLAGAVAFLQEKTGGSAQAVADMGLDARSLKAALSLTRADGEVFADALDKIAIKANRAGATQAAFEEQTKATDFTLRQASSALAVASIKLGDALAPALIEGAKALSKLADFISGLTDNQRKWLVGIGLVVAAIPPLLGHTENLIKAVGLLKVAYDRLAGSATRAAGASDAQSAAAQRAAMTNRGAAGSMQTRAMTGSLLFPHALQQAQLKQAYARRLAGGGGAAAGTGKISGGVGMGGGAAGAALGVVGAALVGWAAGRSIAGMDVGGGETFEERMVRGINGVNIERLKKEREYDKIHERLDIQRRGKQIDILEELGNLSTKQVLELYDLELEQLKELVAAKRAALEEEKKATEEAKKQFEGQKVMSQAHKDLLDTLRDIGFRNADINTQIKMQGENLAKARKAAADAEGDRKAELLAEVAAEQEKLMLLEQERDLETRRAEENAQDRKRAAKEMAGLKNTVKTVFGFTGIAEAARNTQMSIAQAMRVAAGRGRGGMSPAEERMANAQKVADAKRERAERIAEQQRTNMVEKLSSIAAAAGEEFVLFAQ